ncbi:MAG TPA: cytochrome c maturation protein CcmE [Vicinamibacterales bacterium]|nr:cytochrome c maturation protein CcmE [Vicinamibacterales bacterium]
MANKFAKIAVTAVVLLSAFGGLLWYSLRQDAAYYMHVDEVMVSPGQWRGKSLQLHGFVVKGTWMQKPNTLEYQFKVENKGSVVHAAYTGILPDTFKDEAEVVLKGRLVSDSSFQVEPNGVMAKCPSKYEEAKPGYDLKSKEPATSTSN